MKIKINQILTTFNGKPLLENKQTLILKDVIVGALLTPNNRILSDTNEVLERGDTELVKQAKWTLAKKFKDLEKIEEVDITISELNLISETILKIYPQLISGQCVDMLENTNTTKK